MATGYDYKKYAILYVDDEEISLKYFSKAFSEDFRVLTASNVEEALTILDHNGVHIGIVITDQRMPGKTGVEYPYAPESIIFFKLGISPSLAQRYMLKRDGSARRPSGMNQ